MTFFDMNGREAEIHEVERNRDGSRFIVSAVYFDTGEPVPDDVIDWANDIGGPADEILNSMWG